MPTGKPWGVETSNWDTRSFVSVFQMIPIITYACPGGECRLVIEVSLSLNRDPNLGARSTASSDCPGNSTKPGSRQASLPNAARPVMAPCAIMHRIEALADDESDA